MKVGQILLFALPVFLVLMLASGSAQQGSPSRTGWISDESCGKHHTKAAEGTGWRNAGEVVLRWSSLPHMWW